MKKQKLAYLAIPYTWNAELSFKIANEVAADLMSKGYTVFSPISHSHVVADYLPDKLRFDQEFWMKQDIPILEKCDIMILIFIGENGLLLIKNSKGCQSEIKIASENNIPIEHYQYKLKGEVK